MKTNQFHTGSRNENSASGPLSSPPSAARGGIGFTLPELLVMLATVALVALLFAPALAKARPVSHAFQCLNNLRQLTDAWRQWSGDNGDYLLASANLAPVGPRPNWMLGHIDWDGGNPSNYDTNRDIVKSPLWPYVGAAAPFHCPADQSAVSNNAYLLRVRSYSMSQVFGRGDWLDKSYNPSQTRWRTYAKGAEIVVPSHTLLFLDENVSSINDGAFACASTGNQPADPPTAAMLVDLPSNRHHFAAGFSFADGHTEMHRWTGLLLQTQANYNGVYVRLNVPAQSSWLDAHWLAANLTVLNP